MDPIVQNMLGWVTTWAHFSENKQRQGWLPESAIHGIASGLSDRWNDRSSPWFGVSAMEELVNRYATNKPNLALYADKWATDPHFFDLPSTVYNGKLIHT